MYEYVRICTNDIFFQKYETVTIPDPLILSHYHTSPAVVRRVRPTGWVRDARAAVLSGLFCTGAFQDVSIPADKYVWYNICCDGCGLYPLRGQMSQCLDCSIPFHLCQVPLPTCYAPARVAQNGGGPTLGRRLTGEGEQRFARAGGGGGGVRVP